MLYEPSRKSSDICRFINEITKEEHLNVISNLPVYPGNISTSFTEFLYSLLKLGVAHIPTSHFIAASLLKQ